jgi:hypothetical protein
MDAYLNRAFVLLSVFSGVKENGTPSARIWADQNGFLLIYDSTAKRKTNHGFHELHG